MPTAFQGRDVKADMVAVLDDYFGDEAEEPEDTDELPDIGAEDPIV